MSLFLVPGGNEPDRIPYSSNKKPQKGPRRTDAPGFSSKGYGSSFVKPVDIWKLNSIFRTISRLLYQVNLLRAESPDIRERRFCVDVLFQLSPPAKQLKLQEMVTISPRFRLY